jgi:hypothetical protein
MLMFEKFSYLIIVILIVVSLMTGLVGYYLGSNKNKTQPITQFPNSQTSSPNSFFDSVQSSVKGKITNFDSNSKTITFQNTKNEEQSYQLANNVFIATIPEKGNPATPSTDIKKIETGKNAFLNLNSDNGVFKVNVITYVSSLTPPQPPNPSADSARSPKTPTSPTPKP